MRQDFPFDSTRISGLLDRSGEFSHDAQKRYDDTDLLVSELLECGYDSERGRASLRRINQLHGRFDIPNDDYLYVLSTFVFEPIRWNARFGWRKLTPAECHFRFWREVGQRMGIREIPEMEAFEAFSRGYEREYFQYADSNYRVGCHTRDMLAGWFPRPLRPLVRQAMYALMDTELLKAFGFPRPWPGMRPLVIIAMKCRAMVLRTLPRRRKPLLRTAMRHRGYPHGYEIEKLGPAR